MMAEILRPMFTSLPLPRGVDADELLGGYLIALEGLLPSTLKAVTVHLVKGTWFEEVKFCPRPPELANMVRHEQRRLDAMSRPRLPAPATVPQPFKDLRITQRLRAEELERAGYVFIGECKGHDQFAAQAKKRLLPSGAVHLWAIDQIWAPRAVAVDLPVQEQADAA
jgi:hypothetical protein